MSLDRLTRALAAVADAFSTTRKVGAAAGACGAPPAPAATAPPASPPPKKKDEPPAQLVQIEFLDGKDTKLVSGGAKQWVNLPHYKRFVDGKLVKSLDRLGSTPRYMVRFDRPGNHSFKVKLMRDGGNASYSDAERGHVNFSQTTVERDHATESDGTAILSDIRITVAGKDKWKVEAKDARGKAAQSQTLETRRLVWVKQMKMKKTAAAKSIASVVGEMSKYGIDLKRLSSSSFKWVPNIGNDSDENEMLDAARVAYRKDKLTGKRDPYVVAVIYTDQLAVKEAGVELELRNVEVGPGKGPARFDVKVGGKQKPLWIDIVPGEGWFVSCSYLPNGGTAGTDDSAIGQANCAPLGGAASPAYHAWVDVDVSALPAGRGKLRLKVDAVNRFRAGLSLGDNNTVCVCTRAFWKKESNKDQCEVLTHELGHHFGMVWGGAGKRLDKTSTYYDTSKGHRGTHCHSGVPAGQARYDGDADLAASNCVMYGATNGHGAFCGVCGPQVRKQDLTGGWSKF